MQSFRGLLMGECSISGADFRDRDACAGVMSIGHSAAPTVRQLPIRVLPLPGESLDSWLEATCHQFDCTWGDFADALGLPRHRAAAGTPRWLRHLDPPEAARLYSATGVEAAALQAMTLESLAGTAWGLMPMSYELDRTFPWSRFAFSRFCPRCLADSAGRWPLFWRSGWAFACTVHGCLLVDVCPRCARRQRHHPVVAAIVPDGRRCAKPAPGAAGANPPRCGAFLTEVPVLDLGCDHPAIAAQDRIRQIIDADIADFGIYRTQPVPAIGALADIRALAARALAQAATQGQLRVLPADLAAAYTRVRRREERADVRTEPNPRRWAPRDAITAAVGVTAAVTILNAPDTQTAAEAMRSMITPAHARGRTATPADVALWARTTPALDAAQLNAHGPFGFRNTDLRYSAGTTTPARPDRDTATTNGLAATMPALLWPAWALRLIPPHTNFANVSAGLSVAVLLVQSHMKYATAISLLGEHLTPPALSHALRQLHTDACWEGIHRALMELADYLLTHDCPIDYRRRRDLDYHSLLSAHTWREISAEAKIINTCHALPAARCYLYTMLSGNPARAAPWYRDTDDFAAAVREFPAQLTPLAADALRGEGMGVLRRVGVDEPLRWHPPTQLLDGLVLPGPDPEAIDAAALRELIRHHQPVSTAARHLHTTTDAVRYFLSRHPAREDPPTLSPAVAALAVRLPPDTFRDLLQRQRMILPDIASRFGVSPRIATALAHHYGIDLVHRPRYRIDRDWLYTEYVVHGRPFTALAAQRGISATTLGNRARQLGIPARPAGRASTAASLAAAAIDLEQIPAVLRPALSHLGGATRLDRFAVAARHPTLQAAATELGISTPALSTQIARLERDLGAILFERAHSRDRAMTLTPSGAAVLKVWTACRRNTMSPPPGKRPRQT